MLQQQNKGQDYYEHILYNTKGKSDLKAMKAIENTKKNKRRLQKNLAQI